MASLTFILVVNMVAVLIFLKSRETQRRVPAASLWAGMRDPHIGPVVLTASGQPLPITGLRGAKDTGEEGRVLASAFKRNKGLGPAVERF